MTAGSLLLVAGVFMLVLPGPGWLAIAGGLAILAKDVAWAERALERVRTRLPADEDGSVSTTGHRPVGAGRRGGRRGVDLVVPHPVSDPMAWPSGSRRCPRPSPASSRPAVESLDLIVPEGGITVLVGPSGCGKTTTLKMINRLIEPSGGRLEVLGTEIRDLPAHELRRQIGYVIQQIGLFPHKTIAENIATVPKLLGWDKARTRARVEELTELVGLDPEHLPRYPAALSGGQQQRVGVARALAADPPDPADGRALLGGGPDRPGPPAGRAPGPAVARCRRRSSLVTHDIDEAIKLGDQIAILERRRRARAGRAARGAPAGPGQRLRGRVPRPGAGPQAPRPAAPWATPSWCEGPVVAAERRRPTRPAG